MNLIKEPLEVDFYTSGNSLTNEDHKRVSDYIRKNKKVKSTAKPSKRGRTKTTA